MTDVDVSIRVRLESQKIQANVPHAFSVSDAHPFTVLVPSLVPGVWTPVECPPGPLYLLDDAAWKRIIRTRLPGQLP